MFTLRHSCLSVDFILSTICLPYTFIHTMFIKRTSTAIHCISTDFLNGIVDVMFNNGSVYRYSNVSRRAIANLQLQRNMSLGFWVNNNLLGNKRVKSVQTYAAIPSC